MNPKVPTDLQKVLEADPKAKAQWSELTPDERRDFSDWVNSAEKSETSKRIEEACAILAAGKRRP